MIQKIIKVGTSLAVTIPKRALGELGFHAGDKVSVDVDEMKQSVTIAHPRKNIEESSKWADGFIKRYQKALNALADK